MDAAELERVFAVNLIGALRAAWSPGITRTADGGAAIAVGLATLPPDGPAGGLFNDAGPVSW